MMEAAFSHPLFLTGDKGLESGRHSKPKLVYEGRLVLAVNLNFDSRFKRRLFCKQCQTGSVTLSLTKCSGQTLSGAALTGLSPDWQVFILLDVQHELQAVAHSSLGGEERRAVISGCVERVTLPVAGENLQDTGKVFFLNQQEGKKNSTLSTRG